MTDIKVSVIIPVYNVEKYLRQNLESVANQTLKDIEIICVDDGSTDSSFEIVKEFAEKDSRFIAVSQENGGAGAARNNGLRRAKGKYLSFLDSDDFFDEKIGQFLKENKDEIIKLTADRLAERLAKTKAARELKECKK